MEKPVCKICKTPLIQQSFSLKGHEFKVWVMQCQCNRIKETGGLIRESGIHKEHLEIIQGHHKTIKFSQEDLIDSAKYYLDNIGKYFDLKMGLFLIGPTGIGKTMSIDYVIVKIAELFQVKIRYTTAEELASLFLSKDHYSKSQYRKIKTSSVLFIDDINKKQWDMYDLIDYRAHNGLLTFYASNVEQEADILEILSEPVLSRIKYKSIFDIIENKPSLRKNPIEPA